MLRHRHRSCIEIEFFAMLPFHASIRLLWTSSCSANRYFFEACVDSLFHLCFLKACFKACSKASLYASFEASVKASLYRCFLCHSKKWLSICATTFKQPLLKLDLMQSGDEFVWYLLANANSSALRYQHHLKYYHIPKIVRFNHYLMK